MEHFSLLPITSIIQVLKKMSLVAFCRSYQTCSGVRNIADKAAEQITIPVSEEKENDLGIDIGVYINGEPVGIRIYKPQLNLYEFPPVALQKVTLHMENKLNDFLKTLSFFKWTVISIFPAMYYYFPYEPDHPNCPVHMLLDWVFGGLAKNHITCKTLKSPPCPQMKRFDVLQKLRINRWQVRHVFPYEREKTDWLEKIIECGVIDKRVVFSVSLCPEYINEDLPRIWELFDYLDISVQDFRTSGVLDACFATMDQHLKNLIMSPRQQEVKLSIWSPNPFEIFKVEDHLTLPYSEFASFSFAYEKEIGHRDLQLSPRVLHVPTGDKTQHLMMVIYQGESGNTQRFCKFYTKIHFIVVSEWEKWLKSMKTLFHTNDQLISTDKGLQEIQKVFCHV